MRRKIDLYIGNRLVDLDDQSLILFNYALEDLTNPTIVKNSYSQEITLKGTPNNNALFGDIFRLDRMVSNNGGEMGSDFNPSRKTPFTIFNEMNEILESGYVKLNAVNRKGKDVEYKVSLFGGLGSFIYSLAYDNSGNKRTLADIDYLGTADSESELDFIINAQSVSDAWDTDVFDDDIDSIWKVINFAPAYNGIPEGKFSPDKALVTPSQVGLLNSKTSEGVSYTLRNGYAMVNLAQKYDEWAIKDLRSYMQRPVLSIRAFLEALKRPENNGGYVVNMPFLEKENFLPFKNLWMTLPMIPSIGTIKDSTSGVSVSLSSTYVASKDVGRFTLTGASSLPFGTKITADLSVRLRYLSGNADPVLSTQAFKGLNGKATIIFIQCVAYGSDYSIVGGSKVKAIGRLTGRRQSVKGLADICGYIPQFVNGDDSYDALTMDEISFNKVVNGYEFAESLAFHVESQDVAFYNINITSYLVSTTSSRGGNIVVTGVTGGNSPVPTLFKDYDNAVSPTRAMVTQGETPNIIKYTSSESLRSGAAISKRMLLSTSATPADYLLSFCKIFGLHIVFEQATNEVTIYDRNDLFVDEVIDLTRRVDLSKSLDISPFVFGSKWYDFTLEGVGGAFLDEYKSVHGRDYGMQRIDTGYDFNAEAEGLLEGNAFKNAATILDRSKYYTTMKLGGGFRPSVFMDQGHTYTLWSISGESIDVDIPVPGYMASIVYLNEYGHEGYDIEFARKCEFRTSDNKPVDGANVLLFHEGFSTYDYFNLSDDVPAMDLLNDGVPCWILNPGSADGLRIPIFQRYLYNPDWNVDTSLDFGVPRELDIPSLTYDEDVTLYAKFWRKYLRDRYDMNTKVMTCRVNFGGLQVGNELLRKFYWYDNSLWVLNKIKNYSLTTYDPVECEFIQVQEKDNYLNGQE